MVFKLQIAGIIMLAGMAVGAAFLGTWGKWLMIASPATYAVVVCAILFTEQRKQ